MQDGKHGNHFEVVSLAASSLGSGEANHIGSAATPKTSRNAPASFHISSSHSSGLSMSNGPDSWSHTSIPLSILTNSGSLPSAGTQHAQARNSGAPSNLRPDSSCEVTEREGKVSSSNGSCSALKERDYIGLSDSSSSSVQGGNFTAVPSEEKRAAKALDLDSKDTELRLGFGPSLAAQEVNGLGASQGEARQDGPLSCGSARGAGESRSQYSDCNVVEIATSKTCGLEQTSPEKQSSTTIPRKEQCFSSHEGNSGGVSEKVPHSSPHPAIRPYFNQEPFQAWNGEKNFSVGQERHGGDSHVKEVNHLVKEQSWHSHGVSVQPGSTQEKNYTSREGAVNKQQLSELPKHESHAHHHGAAAGAHSLVPKLPSGSLDLRFAPQDPSAAADRSPYDASAAQKFWQAQISRSLDVFRAPSDIPQTSILELEAGKAGFVASQGGFAPRFMIPMTKNTVPAKRGYLEAIGPPSESRAGYTSENRNDLRTNGAGAGPQPAHGGINQSNLGMSAMDSEMKFGSPQAPKVHTASGLFSWNNVIQLPAGWQMGVDQSKGVYGSLAAAAAAPPMPTRGQIPSQLKGPASGSAAVNEPLSVANKDSHAKSSSVPAKQANKEAQNGTNASEDGGSRAPVVGWPPIRSFRKNTLAAHPKPNAEDQEAPPASSADASDQGQQASLYVKANMDGVPIGRKVDLKAYESYEHLKLALQDMFQRFINGHNGGSNSTVKENCTTSEIKQLNLLHGTDYVLTHEDKDGDWMLVGDVPWEMFVTTVKRLRIMKGSDAIGLGERVSAKLKSQANN